jgi:6-phosphogluconolactonase
MPGGARVRIAAVVCTLLAGCVSAGGALGAPAFTPVEGSPYGTGSAPYAVAFAPGLLATGDYAGGDASVFSFSLATGALTPVTGSPFTTDKGPASVAFGAQGGLFATANIGRGTVSVFAVAPSGALTEVPGSPFAAGGQPRSVAFSPAGGLLATANYTDGTVTLFAVASSGSLTPVPGSPFATGAGPRSVAFSADGQLLAVANGDAHSISVFSVNPVTGTLTPASGSPGVTGGNPYSLAFSSRGLLAVADMAGSGVRVFSVAPSGALAVVAGSPFPTGSSPVSVAFSPNGAMLATADYSSADASVFTVDASGALTPLPGSPYAVGTLPHGVAFNAAGGLIAVANSGDSTVSVLGLAPTATVTAPAAGGTYAIGQHVATRFACADNDYGPGLSNCVDSNGAHPPSGTLDTMTPGTQTYTVTATSQDGAVGTGTVSYTVADGPPLNLTRPVLSGNPRVGQVLACTKGTWAGAPSGIAFQWQRGGSAIPGATAAAYKLAPLDAGSTVQCAVTATRHRFFSKPAVSNGVQVPLKTTRGCPAATGGIFHGGLGRARLGLTRTATLRRYAGSSDSRAGDSDLFCLTPRGVRVGFATADLLRGLPRRIQRQLNAAAVWASTTNPRYGVAGVRAGGAVATSIDGASFIDSGGGYDWYEVPNGRSPLLVALRGQLVALIAIVDRRLLADPTTRTRLLSTIR